MNDRRTAHTPVAEVTLEEHLVLEALADGKWRHTSACGPQTQRGYKARGDLKSRALVELKHGHWRITPAGSKLYRKLGPVREEDGS